eukprot:5935500-Amphidinium_carterae.1
MERPARDALVKGHNEQQNGVGLPLAGTWAEVACEGAVPELHASTPAACDWLVAVFLARFTTSCGGSATDMVPIICFHESRCSNVN